MVCVALLVLLSGPVLSLLAYVLQAAIVVPLLLQRICRLVLDYHPLYTLVRLVRLASFVLRRVTSHSPDGHASLPYESPRHIAVQEDIFTKEMGQQVVALVGATFLNLASIYSHTWAPELHENLRKIRKHLEETEDEYRRCFDPIITSREATAAQLTVLSQGLDRLKRTWLMEDDQRGKKPYLDAEDVVKHAKVWLHLDKHPDVVRRDERLEAVVGAGGQLLVTAQTYFGFLTQPVLSECLTDAIGRLDEVADDISQILGRIAAIDPTATGILDLKTTLSLVGSFINKANEKLAEVTEEQMEIQTALRRPDKFIQRIIDRARGRNTLGEDIVLDDETLPFALVRKLQAQMLNWPGIERERPVGAKAAAGSQ